MKWININKKLPPTDKIVLFATEDEKHYEIGIFGDALPPKYYMSTFSHWTYIPKRRKASDKPLYVKYPTITNVI